MLIITHSLAIPFTEIEFTAIRAQGSGGQNVNKVSNAIHLRFNIHASTLPDEIKERLLSLKDHRISKEGIIVIKSQTSRSLEQNKEKALLRLEVLLRTAIHIPKKRRATKPSRGSQIQRVDSKVKRGKIKAMRGKIYD